MDVLLWLVPTGRCDRRGLCVGGWAGHRQQVEASADRRPSAADDAASRARLGVALAKPLPRRAGHVASQRVEPATGVAVRRTPVPDPAPRGEKLTG